MVQAIVYNTKNIAYTNPKLCVAFSGISLNSFIHEFFYKHLRVWDFRVWRGGSKFQLSTPNSRIPNLELLIDDSIYITIML